METMDLTTIITRRQKAGLTQQQLATRAGISTSTLSEIEGGRRDPLASTLNKIEAALKALEQV